MPSKTTTKRVQADKRAGKSASTQAGEFVREEMEHKKNHKHPIKNREQAIAIGLSKARKAGVKIPARKAAATRARRSPAPRKSS